jgi:predicted acyltransferase
VIFLLGLLLNAFPFTLDKPANLRIPGVLQRIALCYFFAALIFLKARMKTQALIAAALLLGYWLVMKRIAEYDPGNCDRALRSVGRAVVDGAARSSG